MSEVSRRDAMDLQIAKVEESMIIAVVRYHLLMNRDRPVYPEQLPDGTWQFDLHSPLADLVRSVVRDMLPEITAAGQPPPKINQHSAD
jgi:hypothetical protein